MSTSQKKSFQVLLATLPWLRDYQYRIALTLFLLLLVEIIGISMPVVFKEIIDSFSFDTQNPLLLLPLSLLLIYGGLKIASTLVYTLKTMIYFYVSDDLHRRLSLRLFRHLHKLSLRYHLDRKTGGVIQDMQRGATAIVTLVQAMLIFIFPVVIQFILAMLLLTSQYEWHLTLAALTFIIIFAVYIYFASQWRLDIRKELNKQSSETRNAASDSLLNYETVKYFNNEQREYQHYDEAWQKWVKFSIKSKSSFVLIMFGQNVIMALGVTVILIIAANDVAAQRMTVGDLVLINTLFIQLAAPLTMLGLQLRHFKDALVDMEQSVELLNTEPEIQDIPHAPVLAIDKGEICFQGVNFSYDEKRTILQDFHLTIPANKTVAVVGQSGAGKSTLTRLLFRFYDVKSGSICVDGQDIRHVTQHSLRKTMAIVPQDTILFNNTIYFNLAYGNPEASREDIEQAAKMAQIYDFIEDLPEQWETKVGERGLKLSGGEKQRVAIARAILKQPKILLLDEATSSLDSQTEKAIQTTLEALAGNYTTFIIAHRLSSIVHADKIVVMKQGQIVEQGSHSELLKQQGLYAEMWQVQRS